MHLYYEQTSPYNILFARQPIQHPSDNTVQDFTDSIPILNHLSAFGRAGDSFLRKSPRCTLSFECSCSEWKNTWVTGSDSDYHLVGDSCSLDNDLIEVDQRLFNQIKQSNTDASRGRGSTALNVIDMEPLV